MAGYVLKITIEDTHPPVWRRVVVPENITFENLHDVIQILFGWTGYHLHDFAYPKKQFQVVTSEQDWNWGELHLESETPIDPYVDAFPWIRYTYDFGDNWEHRIVFECRMENFEERHAVLLKLKGDSFDEDCGGVWDSGDENRIPADEMEINRQLSEMNFQLFQKKEEDMAMQSQEMLENEVDLPFRMSGGKVSYLSDEERNMLKKCLHTDWQNGSAASQHESKASGLLEEWCLDTVSIFEAGDPISISFRRSAKKIADFLTDWQKEKLMDDCVFLGIAFRKTAMKKTLAKALANEFRKHPECVWLFFSEQELQTLNEYLTAAKQQTPCAYDHDTGYLTVVKAVYMGLFRIVTPGRHQVIEVADDVPDLLTLMYTGDRKPDYEWLDKIDQALATVIITYGMVDLDFLRACCERIRDVELNPTEFRRLACWHGIMNEVFISEDQNGTEQVLMPELDIEKVTCIRNKFGQTLEYRSYSDEELKLWEQGFFIAVQEWLEYSDVLQMLTNEDENNVYAWITEDYVDLMSGMTATALLEEWYDYFEAEMTPVLGVELWDAVMPLVMKTPLAGLKGHSRESYAARMGKPLDAIPLFDETKLNQRITKHTMLHQFPAALQMEIYEKSQSLELREYLVYLDRLLKTYKGNEALVALRDLMVCDLKLIENPGLEEDLLMYEQLQKAGYGNFYPWNEDLWEAMKPVVEPYVREQPKVGRNDPCPCGSGKKYKKCCGR